MRGHLDEDTYVTQVAHQQQHDNYTVAALFHDGEIRAVAGFRLATGLALGHYVYIDDLVTDDTARSEGFGGKLMAWVGQYGKDRGCTSLHLDSGVQRHSAHRFYLRERMDIVFYHFRSMLD
ncbi:MAG: GNAT family N-acetyltransferase [Proteobacteria bacterium]|nr:GNAT family N-acetyltransferase [Pseudomonadota bacterium]MCP4917463.1 GNAT family N-acetyltransferase [Pseudomonadota bacterium]